MAKNKTQPKKLRALTVKQQRFVDCYNGDIKEAAKKCGLAYSYCRKLGTKKHILDAIKNRLDTEVRPRDIADRQERQRYWTKGMRGKIKKFSPSDRNKASELLGRSEADFTDNLAHDLKTPLVDMFAMIAAKKKK